MSGIVFEAPPRSGESIEHLADAIRRTFGLEDETFFPIVEFVEKGLPLVVKRYYGANATSLVFGALPFGSAP